MLGPEAFVSAQTSIVILSEISCLVRQIGTAVTPLFTEASGVYFSLIKAWFNFLDKINFPIIRYFIHLILMLPVR